MASYARCLLFFMLALSFSLQIHARESKFFSKVTKSTKPSHDSISIAPTISPTLAPAPAPEPEVVEHGYGLYGRDPYEYPRTTTIPAKTPVFDEEKNVQVDEFSKNNNQKFEKFEGEYQFPPTTSNPTKTPTYGDEFENYVPAEEYSKNNVEELEKSNSNNKLYGNGNEYVSAKQGMSDTRFLENGKYYHDVSQEGKNVNKYVQNEGNGNGNEQEYVPEKHGMSDTRFMENGKYYYDLNSESAKEEKNEHFDVNRDGKNVEKYLENEGKGNEFGSGNGNGYVTEKQGMSDTRFLENGKYYYDLNSESAKEKKNEHFDANKYENERFNANKYGNEQFNANDNEEKHFNANNNEEEQFNNANDNEEHFEEEKQGMSDTRFLNNGEHFYDVKNENEKNPGSMYYDTNSHVNQEFLNNNNNNNGYNGNSQGNEMENYNEGNNEYVSKESSGYNYNGNPKKLPNEYDTMEEYDREQGIVDPRDAYVP